MMRLPHHLVFTLLVSHNIFLRGVVFLVLAGFAGEENEAFAVGFQARDVDSEAFDRAVGAARVDADADRCSEFSGDARLLGRNIY